MLEEEHAKRLHAHVRELFPDAWEHILTHETINEKTESGRKKKTKWQLMVRYARNAKPYESKWLDSPEAAIEDLKKSM